MINTVFKANSQQERTLLTANSDEVNEVKP